MKIFIDANVLIEAGKPPGGAVIEKLQDLATTGIVDVLTTDHTIMEVAKHHASRDWSHLKAMASPKFRAAARQHVGLDLPNVSLDEMYPRIVESYRQEVTTMLASLSAKILDIDSVTPSKILADYSMGRGLFSDGAKKDQFPDAFIFERIVMEAEETAPLTIISKDKDFDDSANNHPHVMKLGDIEDLFTALDVEFIKGDALPLLMQLEDGELEKFAEEEMQSWWLSIGDVEDAEVLGIEVDKVSLKDATYFASQNKSLLLSFGSAELFVNVQYIHPDWATGAYDSETKRVMPRREITGVHQTSIDVDILVVVNPESERVRIVSFEIRAIEDGNIYIDQPDSH